PPSGPKLNEERHRDFAGRFILTVSDTAGRTQSRQPDGQETGVTPLSADASRGVVFTYSGSGQRETMTDGSGANQRVTRYVYDEYDRLRIKNIPEGTLTYGYDPAGNVTLISARKTYTFPANSPYDFTSISAPGTDANNPNGAYMAYEYDTRSRLWEVKESPSG